MEHHNSQSPLFETPTELSRRAETAIDQGVSNNFMEQERAAAEISYSDIDLEGLASAIRSVRPPVMRHMPRKYNGGPFEQGAPSGREESRLLAQADAAASPPLTNEQRAYNLERVEQLRMNNRLASARKDYDRLVDSCRNDDGTINQAQLNARLKARADREAQRKARHDADVARLQTG